MKSRNCFPLVACLVILNAAVAVQAAPVTFNYVQTDATTGSGTITEDFDTTTLGGPGMLTFTAALPAATVVQKDANTGFTVPAGAVGFITTADSSSPGTSSGIYIGFSGTLTLTATSGADTYSIDVPLTMRAGNSYNYSYDVFDNPAENDVTGDPYFAGWPGDNGAGHRHSNGHPTFVAGQDNYTASASGALGNHSDGDNLGIGAGIRGGSFNGPVFVDNLAFGGVLDAELYTLAKNGAAITAPDTDSFFQVTIDIGPEAQRVQSGHVGAPNPNDPATPNNNNGGAEPSLVAIDTGTGTIFMSISDTDAGGNDDGQIDWRDRGDSTNGDDLVRLGEDFIKNNGGIIRLTFDGLPKGRYDATSFHVDSNFSQCELIRVLVDNGDGNGFVDTLATGDASHNNGGVNGLTTDGILDSSATFRFFADGVHAVSILFDGNDASDTEVPLNGLILSYAPVPEPSSLALLLLAAIGATGGAWRRKRGRVAAQTAILSRTITAPAGQDPDHR